MANEADAAMFHSSQACYEGGCVKMHFNGHTIPFVLYKVLFNQYKRQKILEKQVSKEDRILK